MDKAASKRNIPKPTYFGRNLKFLRKRKKLSQSQLASDLNLKRNNIASYESNMVEPNINNFLQFCTYFGVQPEIMTQIELTELNLIQLAAHGQVNQEMNKKKNQLQNLLLEIESATNAAKQVNQGYTLYYNTLKTKQNKNSEILNATVNDILEILNQIINLNQSVFAQINYKTNRL